SFAVESVAAFAWNGWQASSGISGNLGLEYALMIIPIAYVFIDDMLWEDPTVHDKIEYWYWASLFSGNYIFNQNKCIFRPIVTAHSV
ncbi:hypothetical protein, partial [Marinobacter sp. MBR-105]